MSQKMSSKFYLLSPSFIDSALQSEFPKRLSYKAFQSVLLSQSASFSLIFTKIDRGNVTVKGWVIQVVTTSEFPLVHAN